MNWRIVSGNDLQDSPLARASFLDEFGRAQPGLLSFRVDDFDLALQRARALVASLDEEPHVNPSTETREFSLRDPDGYYVTISVVASRRA